MLHLYGHFGILAQISKTHCFSTAFVIHNNVRTTAVAKQSTNACCIL